MQDAVGRGQSHTDDANPPLPFVFPFSLVAQLFVASPLMVFGSLLGIYH